MKTIRTSKSTYRLCLTICLWLSLSLGLLTNLQAQTPFLQGQKLVGTNPLPLAEYGLAIAIDGNTAVVGEQSDNVYVYVRQGYSWGLQAKLVSPSGSNTGFGSSVAISGGTIVVGDSDNGFKGAAYVYVRTGSAWTLQQRLSRSHSQRDDLFGYAVAISGNTIAIGAPGENSVRGAIYTYVRTGTVWAIQQRLVATDGASGDWFGRSLALSGNTVIAGAMRGDLDPDHVDQGAAYVFNRSGTSWSETQKLYAVDGEAGDWFSKKLAMHNDTLVVGANSTNLDLSHVDQGVAHVFRNIGGSWMWQQKLYQADGQAGDLFGEAVAVNGATIVVTRSGRSGVPGFASVFVESGGYWLEQQQLVAQDAEVTGFLRNGDVYGATAAIGNNGGILNGGGQSILIGSFVDTIAGNLGQGSVYAFSNVCPPVGIFSRVPVVNPVSLPPIQAGTIVRNEQIATLLQPACAAAGTLSVSVINHTPGDFTISNVVNQNGLVSADLAVSCAAVGRTLSYTLVVSNGSTTVTKRLYVSVIANQAPYFGYRYDHPFVVLEGEDLSIPGIGVYDNGTVTSGSISSTTFGGQIGFDATTGNISIGTASPLGTHTLTVTYFDNCGALRTESIELIVTEPL